MFKGVRYAAAPLGAAYRFKAPGKVQSWTGVRDALAFGAASIQAPNAGTLGGTTPNEDCLFLNIWTPATGPDGRKRAVMYYLHGGGFTSGRAMHGARTAPIWRATTMWWWWRPITAWVCWAICGSATCWAANTRPRATRACST